MDKKTIDKEIQKLSEAQNPEDMKLGGLVREVVDLALGMQDTRAVKQHLEAIGNSPEEFGDAVPKDYSPLIEAMGNRTESLYAELDRREEGYIPLTAL